jgi:1,4-alpha-glucan branching enzyme
MVAKVKCSAPDKVRVTFDIPACLWAGAVHLVGDFNDWRHDTLPLVRSNLHSAWKLTLELERGKQYQYRYLLDGERWCNDCNADRYVSNPFGGTNSVVET